MAWDLAWSLVRLRQQVDQLAPRRSRRSDGTIGDRAHQGTRSDHNPEDKPGTEPDEVDAWDVTHDPAGGCDVGRIFEAIRLSCLAGRENRVAYLIFRRRYCSRNTGWKWWPYDGDNPHDEHGHVSVNDRDDDNPRDWEIGQLAGGPVDEDDQEDPMPLKPAIVGVHGRQSRYLKEPGRPLLPLLHPWQLGAARQLGAVEVDLAPSAAALVHLFGGFEGVDQLVTVDLINRAG